MQGKDRQVAPRFSRRDALKLLMGAGMALAGGRALGASEPSPLLKRNIPATGEAIPAVGLGTSRVFDVGSGESERAPRREVLRLFVEAGARLVDTSPMYGQAETVVGDLAAELGVQDALFLATKVWTKGREAGIEQMETSMGRLRTQRIDLMQVHNLVDWQTHLRTLRDWKAQGRIRYVGITHYETSAFEDLERLIKGQDLDFVQLNYSIETPEAQERLLPLAADQAVAVLVNRPFEAGGLFRKVRGQPLPGWAVEFDCTSWGQFFLKYILAHPAVTCVIPATSKPRHLVDNLQAGQGRLPDGKTRRKMVEYVRKL